MQFTLNLLRGLVLISAIGQPLIDISKRGINKKPPKGGFFKVQNLLSIAFFIVIATLTVLGFIFDCV
jgi:hypothetical protein